MSTKKPTSEYIGINEVKNVNAGEYQDVKGWLSSLKEAEQARVRAALRFINGLGSPITTIVAGSSVYPGQVPMKKVQLESDLTSSSPQQPDNSEIVRGSDQTRGSGPTPSYLWQPDQAEIARGRGHYRSIDLFVMFSNTAEVLEQLLKKRGESVHVPNRVYYVRGGEARRRVFDLGMNPAEAAYNQEVSGVANVPVVVSPLRDSTPSLRSFVLSRNYPLSE